MLMRACDVRLPARLTADECDAVAGVLVAAAEAVMAPAAPTEPDRARGRRAADGPVVA